MSNDINSNNVAMGYALMGMKLYNEVHSKKITRNQMAEILACMMHSFDEKTEFEAEQYYLNS